MNRSNTSPRSFSTDQLRAVLGDVGGSARPDYLPDIVAQAGRTRQRPAWTFLKGWGSTDSDLRRHGVPRVAVVFASVFLLVALLAAGIVYVGSQLSQPERPYRELGIFEPIAGRIIYCDNPDDRHDLWSVDPSAPSPVPTLARIGLECASSVVPLGWSSDGAKLLFLREDPPTPGQQPPFDSHLYILHADGTETRVTVEPVRDAAISPDGSRVAFSTTEVPGRVSLGAGLYVVDAEGGSPVRIAQEGTSPTFSPDGTQIAYLSSPPGVTVFGVTGGAPVWVVDADGTGAHEILTDEPALAKGDFRPKRLKWSPAGDRIAVYRGGEGQDTISTFAPDGSDFTMVISGGADPHWSPDGSRIAYGLLGRDGLSIADAGGSNVRTFAFGAPGPWHPGE